MTPPIPQRKPDINSASGETSILDRIFDFGRNAVEQAADFGMQIWEAEQLQKLREIENQGAARRQTDLSGQTNPSPTGQVTYMQGQPMNVTQLAAVALLGVGAIFLAK